MRQNGSIRGTAINSAVNLKEGIPGRYSYALGIARAKIRALQDGGTLEYLVIGGGGGGGNDQGTGGAGGSGVVIFKIPDTNTATFSGGVTSSLSTAVAGYKIYTVTATSDTSQTVTFT